MSILDRRFVLFSGKGGVGKTTLASAYALNLARRGRRTLLIQLNTKDHVSAMFGSLDIGTEIVEIEENLHAVNITPKAALEEYALMVLKVRLVYRAVFENRIVASFLRVIPGLNELVMLGKAHFHVREVDARGRHVWDHVVVDAPATGHGIFLLRIPSVVTSLISSGPMYDDAKRIEDDLRNPETTALNIVTLPEDMPVNETLMLRDSVAQDLGVPIGFVVANAIYEPRFAQDQELLDLEAHDDLLEGFLDAARFRSQRVAMQKGHLERLREEFAGSSPLVEVPFYFTERIDFQTLVKIASCIDEGLDASDKEQEPVDQAAS